MTVSPACFALPRPGAPDFETRIRDVADVDRGPVARCDYDVTNVVKTSTRPTPLSSFSFSPVSKKAPPAFALFRRKASITWGKVTRYPTRLSDRLNT
jgi:hypothetical protein